MATNNKIDNILKISAIIAILLIASAVFYYSVIFKSNEQKQLQAKQAEQQKATELKNLQNMQIKCKEAGEKLYNAEKAKGEELNDASYVYSPEYYYNQKRNICLYSRSSMMGFPEGAKRPAISITVTNVYTNETVLSFIQNIYEDENQLNKRRAEFDLQYKKLFSE